MLVAGDVIDNRSWIAAFFAQHAQVAGLFVITQRQFQQIFQTDHWHSAFIDFRL